MSEADTPDCTAETGHYDLGLHVASLFVILAASSIGVFIPVAFGTADRSVERKEHALVRLSKYSFFVLKYFGTGIIISLA